MLNMETLKYLKLSKDLCNKYLDVINFMSFIVKYAYEGMFGNNFTKKWDILDMI